MVDNITSGQMNQINATTQQQVDDSKVEVLKSIASVFKDIGLTTGKTAKGTLKSTQEAMDFKSEIDKIITEGDLSRAFKKFNDKLYESNETISDYIDAQDDANKQFIKNFNKYSKERTNAERKQSNLARENIATRIDENNELQILKNFEIDEQQKKIKGLRDEIEEKEKYLKRTKGLSAEEISAKFDEIEERRLQIREIKDLGVKEKKKFDDTMFRFEFLDNAIAYLDEETLKTRQSVGNFITGITPDPIIDAFRTFTSAFATATQPLLGLLKPLKIFIPLFKIFGFIFGKTVVKPMQSFGRFLTGAGKSTKKLGEQTEETTKSMKTATDDIENFLLDHEEKEGVKDKKRTGLFGKLGGAIGKVTGAFARFVPMILPLTILIGVLTAVFFIFKKQILSLLAKLGLINAPGPTNTDEVGDSTLEILGAFGGRNEVKSAQDLADSEIEKEIAGGKVIDKKDLSANIGNPFDRKKMHGKKVSELDEDLMEKYRESKRLEMQSMEMEDLQKKQKEGLMGPEADELIKQKFKNKLIKKKKGNKIKNFLGNNFRFAKFDEEDMANSMSKMEDARIRAGFGTDEQKLERGSYMPNLTQMTMMGQQAKTTQELQAKFDASRIKTGELQASRNNDKALGYTINNINQKSENNNSSMFGGKRINTDLNFIQRQSLKYGLSSIFGNPN